MICVTERVGPSGASSSNSSSRTCAVPRGIFLDRKGARAVSMLLSLTIRPTFVRRFRDVTNRSGPSAQAQTQLELNAVEAAQRVGVRHIVKLFVMGPATRPTPSP